MDFRKQLKRGLVTENPVLVQLLGMCSVLAITTSVSNGLGMGVSVTAILICSNVVISLLRKIIPDQIRIAAYIVVIAGFVTMVDLLLQAFFPEIAQSLGVLIPLIVVNCIILARAEAYASRNKVLPSMLDGLSMGLGFTFALTVMATIREIIGAGTFLGIDLFGGHYSPVMILVSPPGAFLTLGFIIAVVQKIRNTIDDKKRLEKLRYVEFEDRSDRIKQKEEQQV